MATQPVGFHFRERMQGPFAAGIDDPPAGAAQGRVEQTRFVADLHVEIDDLAACVSDPMHGARLTGTATFPGLATQQPIRGGSLCMYVSDPVTRTKLMRYQFAFSGDAGGEYFLDGTKFMHTPGASAREQITLYTRVHTGSPNGPVWGSGVLVFRLRDLPGFLFSMRTQGASRVEGLRRFLGFARHELASPVTVESAAEEVGSGGESNEYEGSRA